MGFVKAHLRQAFALLVIAHGLAHTVLPMRGWMQPETLAKDFMPVILYGTAILGFCAAGIGLLGVRPFTAATRPLLVLASGYSLVALGLMGDGGLWWGATVDVALLLTGLTAAYEYLPAAHASRGRVRHALGVTAAFGFLAYAACAAVLVAAAPRVGIAAARTCPGVAG